MLDGSIGHSPGCIITLKSSHGRNARISIRIRHCAIEYYFIQCCFASVLFVDEIRVLVRDEPMGHGNEDKWEDKEQEGGEGKKKEGGRGRETKKRGA